MMSWCYLKHLSQLHWVSMPMIKHYIRGLNRFDCVGPWPPPIYPLSSTCPTNSIPMAFFPSLTNSISPPSTPPTSSSHPSPSFPTSLPSPLYNHPHCHLLLLSTLPCPWSLYPPSTELFYYDSQCSLICSIIILFHTLYSCLYVMNNSSCFFHFGASLFYYRDFLWSFNLMWWSHLGMSLSTERFALQTTQ